MPPAKLTHCSASRVLAIHPGALGDVVQAVPALRALGRTHRVTFCGQPRLGELLRGAGVVAEAVSFDGFGLEMLFAPAPAPPSLVDHLADFDRVVSWFGSRDEGYCARLLRHARGPVVAPPVPDGPTPVWQHLLATIGASRRAARCEALQIPASWRQEAFRAIEDAGVAAGIAPLLVHPGAGGHWKLISPETLARAIAPALARGDVPVLVHEGPADREAVERFVSLIHPQPARLIEPSLPCLAAVLSVAAAYVGGDSGVSHLAAAVGAAAVIFYPTSTRERWAPWSPTARVIDLESGDEAAADAAAHALRQVLRA